jgi:hypothetical protein
VPVRFYVDADLLGLAKVLCHARDDWFTYPGDPGGNRRPPGPITTAQTPDRVWIPQVAEMGWVAITKDRKIKSRPDERAAVMGSSARHVTLVGKQALGVWLQLEIVMSRWRKIQELTDLPGPWVYSMSLTGTTKTLPR